MKKYQLIIILLLSLMSCNNSYEDKILATDYISSDSDVVLKINSDYVSINSLNPNFPISNTRIDTIIRSINYLDTGEPIYLGIRNDDFIIASDMRNGTTYKDSINETLYYRIVDSIFLASNNQDNLIDIEKKAHSKFTKLFNTSNNKSSSSIFSSDPNNNLLLTHTLQSESEFLIDIYETRNSKSFNGIGIPKDTSDYQNYFKDVRPQEFLLAQIIPDNVINIERLAYDNYTTLLKNITSTDKDSLNDFLKYTNEIARLDMGDDQAVAISVLDKTLIEEFISTNDNVESHKDVSIFKFDQPQFFQSSAIPFLAFKDVNFFFSIEDFYIFSNKTEILKTIIDSKLNNQTLSESEKFKSLSAQLAKDSHFLIYKNEYGLKSFLGKSANGYNANATQFIFDNNITHVNGIISKHKKARSTNTVSEDFSIKLSQSIIMQPQPVKNHITGDYDIVTQDADNTLYLISNNGTIRWTRKLNAPVLGKVEQIDAYKNRRLQLTFATKNRVYVIDRNGKDVGEFPLKFNDDITQPLSVFDYDKNKNYRLLVTQDKNLLMYDAKGKSIKGFNYDGANNTIASQPKHFRVSTKDYIVFSDSNKLEILNRKGKQRVDVKGEIEFSDNPIFNYRNKFTTLNTNNQLVSVDTRGNINLKPIDLQASAQIDATSKTIAALGENQLKINSKVVDLEFGDYTDTKIFYVGNKLYITITDLQSKKLYVYDSQAKLLPNFPVYANSNCIIENIDNQGKPEIITLSDNQTILVYKMN